MISMMGSMQQMQHQNQIAPTQLQAEYLKNQQMQQQMEQQQQEAPLRELMNAVAAHRALTGSVVDGHEMARPITETPGMEKFLQMHPPETFGLDSSMYPTLTKEEIYNALMTKMSGGEIDPEIMAKALQSKDPSVRLLLEHKKK